jgi:hypothetical protein
MCYQPSGEVEIVEFWGLSLHLSELAAEVMFKTTRTALEVPQQDNKFQRLHRFSTTRALALAAGNDTPMPCLETRPHLQTPNLAFHSQRETRNRIFVSRLFANTNENCLQTACRQYL